MSSTRILARFSDAPHARRPDPDPDDFAVHPCSSDPHTYSVSTSLLEFWDKHEHPFAKFQGKRLKYIPRTTEDKPFKIDCKEVISKGGTAKNLANALRDFATVILSRAEEHPPVGLQHGIITHLLVSLAEYTQDAGSVGCVAYSAIEDRTKRAGLDERRAYAKNLVETSPTSANRLVLLSETTSQMRTRQKIHDHANAIVTMSDTLVSLYAWLSTHVLSDVRRIRFENQKSMFQEAWKEWREGAEATQPSLDELKADLTELSRYHGFSADKLKSASEELWGKLDNADTVQRFIQILDPGPELPVDEVVEGPPTPSSKTTQTGGKQKKNKKRRKITKGSATGKQTESPVTDEDDEDGESSQRIVGPENRFSSLHGASRAFRENEQSAQRLAQRLKTEAEKKLSLEHLQAAKAALNTQLAKAEKRRAKQEATSRLASTAGGTSSSPRSKIREPSYRAPFAEHGLGGVDPEELREQNWQSYAHMGAHMDLKTVMNEQSEEPRVPSKGNTRETTTSEPRPRLSGDFITVRKDTVRKSDKSIPPKMSSRGSSRLESLSPSAVYIASLLPPNDSANQHGPSTSERRRSTRDLRRRSSKQNPSTVRLTIRGRPSDNTPSARFDQGACDPAKSDVSRPTWDPAGHDTSEESGYLHTGESGPTASRDFCDPAPDTPLRDAPEKDDEHVDELYDVTEEESDSAPETTSPHVAPSDTESVSEQAHPHTVYPRPDRRRSDSEISYPDDLGPDKEPAKLHVGDDGAMTSRHFTKRSLSFNDV